MTRPHVARRIAAGAIVLALAPAMAQAQRGGFPPAPQSPRLAAPIDLTGYWVSLVTEDWRYRVATPPKGDYNSVPLNPAGRKAADAWDPARDEAAGEQCKAYGVGGVMRLPGRLHVVWQDDRTLTIETDAGTQVRTLRFGPATTSASDWQGNSQASWDRMEGAMGAGLLFGGGGFGVGKTAGGSLKVVTKGMKPGYLRKNGVPYSADAVITEYVDRFDLPGGDALLVVSTEVVDPTYLAQPFWDQHPFQEAARRDWLEADAVYSPMIPHTAKTHRHALIVVVGLFVLAMIDVRGQAPAPAPAPGFDLSGFWSPVLHEDGMDRGAGPEIGDYGGIPINEAGRLFALSLAQRAGNGGRRSVSSVFSVGSDARGE
jgi:hypothetical protein